MSDTFMRYVEQRFVCLTVKEQKDIYQLFMDCGKFETAEFLKKYMKEETE